MGQGSSSAASAASGAPRADAAADPSAASSADPFAMRAWVCEKVSTGPCTAALRMVTLPRPEPRPNELLVRVVCAGCNPLDFQRLQTPSTPFPLIAGVDGAGVVEAVGADVSAAHEGGSPSVGDRVYFHQDIARTHGTFAEYCTIDVALAIKIPAGVSYSDAAATPCAGWTAYTALFSKLRIESGRVIVINGAAGGVGTFAVQLAKRMGLYVIATCSTANCAFVRDTLGADFVIDYTQESILECVLLTTKGVGVDYVLDLVGADAGVLAAQLLRFGGSMCIIAGGPVQYTDQHVAKQLSVHHVLLSGFFSGSENRHVLQQVGQIVMGMLQQGAVCVPAKEVIKFDQVPLALDTLRGRHGRGKIVAVIDNKKASAAATGEIKPSVEAASIATP